jgi:hypothetical protein
VCAEVDGQCAALDEALIAISDSAAVRSLVGMDAMVSVEVGLAVEGLLRPTMSFDVVGLCGGKDG